MHETTDRPRSDEGWWLYEYQKLVVNVQALVSRGQNESATRMMLDMSRRWSEARDA